jgi:O-antigen/teichoic acid export membrane protein
LVDQFMVSGASFLTAVLIGRNCSENELALYALAASTVVFANSLQLSIISVPYSIRGTRLSETDRPGYAGSTLVHQVLFSGLWAVCLLAAAGLLVFSGQAADSAAMALVLAAAFVPVLLKEYVRRIELAHLRVAAACRLDAVSTALQLGGLLLLANSALLSARTAYAAIGAACGMAAMGGLWLRRDRYAPRLANVGVDFRRSWELGKWVLASQAINAAIVSVVPWLLAFLRPTSAETAVFSACQGVALLANPFLLGMSGYVGPKATHAYTSGGIKALQLVVTRMAWFLAAVAGTFALLMLTCGEQIVVALYGSHYAGHGATVSALALTVFVYAVSLAPDLGLWAMERAELNVKPRLIGLAFTFGGGICLVPALGAFGGACGLLAGNTAAAIATIYIYRTTVSAEA